MKSVSILIQDPFGLHTRVAAMLVNKSGSLKSKYGVNLYIQKPPSSEWFGISMLALISLKVQCGDEILIGCNDDSFGGDSALNEFKEYIISVINKQTQVMEKIDAFIEEGKIANEQIIDNIPIGIIVIDLDCKITNVNKYAVNIINKDFNSIIGKNIQSLIPNSLLPNILETQKKQYGHIQYINNKVVTVNRSPIISNNQVIGAVASLQDVSDLIGMKELNEKFLTLLEYSNDLICFVDESGNITYVNPAYKKVLCKKNNNVIGKSIFDISPNGYRAKALKSKSNYENIIHTKESIEIITTINPIFIDGKFKGIMSISKPINEIKELMSKLDKYKEELKYYKEELFKYTNLSSSFRDIIGISNSLKNILYICDKASKSTSTVLLRGESGTGKELLANAIHNSSSRKNKPFIKLNCASIPENLLESELFGYEKGAFTGAVKNKPGKFLIADGGTIFLDEIGDLPLSMQAKLLRAIQEQEIESVGGLSPKKIDVRIIAATNRNLEEMIKENQFREDLYYRLNVIPINVPALRDRKEDIPSLVEHLIKKVNKKLGTNVKGIDRSCIEILSEYSWPGNIRELENIIERAINLCEGDTISIMDLPFHLQDGHNKSHKNIIDTNDDELLTFEEYEKMIIEKAMRIHKTFNKAGKALGLTHRTISLKCKKYNISVDK